MKKILFLTFIILLFYLRCESAQKTNNVEKKNSKYIRESIPRSEIEKIKECNQKLDLCFKLCSIKYSEVYTRDPRRSECKELCVEQLKMNFECIIHSDLSRSRYYRSALPP